MDHKKIILFDKPEKYRKNKEIVELTDDIKSFENQQLLLKSIQQKEFDNTTNSKLAKREINKKILSYKKQDITKKRYNEALFITFDETIDLLCESNLLCYYCRNQMYIFYDNVREKRQWTLDRVDNDICHSKDNLVVSCLSCNLQKRRRESEAFKFMKQLKIKKNDN